tara:strand:- start:122 stop:514 length:393 start_codon:yes stop_codon:yes gene_type:complete
MNSFPLEILYLINNCLCCKDKSILNYVSKVFYKKDNCCIIEYIQGNKKLEFCKIHGDKKIKNIILKLKNADRQKKINTIHFDSSESLEIAKPFLEKYGLISHYCCDNTGVMYLSGLNNPQSELYSFWNTI